MKKKNRYMLGYRIRMWLYRLTKQDFIKFGFEMLDGINALFAILALLFFLFVLPAFFH